MKNLVIPLFCILLSACTSAPVTHQTTDQLLDDSLFAAPSERVSADDLFVASDEMKHYLSTEIADQLRRKGIKWGLIEALNHKSQLKLEYDSSATRNAAETFHARSGNCLSLVIMTAALAKQLDLPVRYQSVIIDDIWSRNGNIDLLTGHVNLTLGKTEPDLFHRGIAEAPTTIDFLPPEEIGGWRSLVISESTVVAMYLNNRAVESINHGRLDDSYWWAREAIRQAPTYISAYNTLGVIYRRHGNLPQAEQVFKYILTAEPENRLVIPNLIQVLNELGRTAESQQLSEKLAKIEPYPPFYYFDLGLKAMQQADYKRAKALFTKEVNRAAYYHEFQFWLAVAEFQLGDVKGAREHLVLAMDNSTTRRDHDLYAAKLDQIKSFRLH